MTPSPASTYADEIRAWLVGRLERKNSAGSIALSPTEQMPARVQLWWLLEGKQFPLIAGTLARNWHEVLRHVQRLLTVHSPANRVVPVPEGEIDWLASALQRITAGRQEFHVRASRTGLSDDERAVLLEWLDWVGRQWETYCRDVGAPAEYVGTLPLARPGPERIKRWAHIGGRSRWPLLRQVVAGSLRVFLEPVELDALPLPTDPPRLFELLCIVRVLRAIEDAPKSIRWLDRDLGNSVRAGSTTVSMQLVPSHPILETPEFDHALRAAIERHGVRVPKFIDVLVEFDTPRGGFDGILIEAKSGAQHPDAAIPQLRAYRAALRAEGYKRLLVWGIVEASWPWSPPSTSEVAAKQDLWVFSDASHIDHVLRATGVVT